MIQQFFTGQFTTSMHLRLFKQILACCLTVSVLIYAVVRIIFFDIPFEWIEELMMIGKLLLTGASFAACICGLLLTADVIQYSTKKWQALQPVFTVKKLALAMLLLVIAISACNAQQAASGILKDNTTGLTATYKTLKPGKLLLVMNDEVLHHTDIPFGESFLLVNNGIKGLVEKDGKVAVGCSLLMKDKKGIIMIKADDLFKGKDTFEKDSVKFLQCTVPTGKPMNWEEKYDITVIFWDKYGTGKIENKVTIRCIDIP